LDSEINDKIIIYSLFGIAVIAIILTMFFYVISGVFSIWLGALIITTSLCGSYYKLKTNKLYLNLGLLFLGIWMAFTPAVFEIANIDVSIFVTIIFISFGILITIISIFEME
jgi:hypothetical protein